jgi:hypothetical protein
MTTHSADCSATPRPAVCSCTNEDVSDMGTMAFEIRCWPHLRPALVVTTSAAEDGGMNCSRPPSPSPLSAPLVVM